MYFSSPIFGQRGGVNPSPFHRRGESYTTEATVQYHVTIVIVIPIVFILGRDFSQKMDNVSTSPVGLPNSTKIKRTSAPKSRHGCLTCKYEPWHPILFRVKFGVKSTWATADHCQPAGHGVSSAMRRDHTVKSIFPPTTPCTNQ